MNGTEYKNGDRVINPGFDVRGTIVRFERDPTNGRSDGKLYGDTRDQYRYVVRCDEDPSAKVYINEGNAAKWRAL